MLLRHLTLGFYLYDSFRSCVLRLSVTPHSKPLTFSCMLKAKKYLNRAESFRLWPSRQAKFARLCQLSSPSRGLPVSVELRQHNFEARDRKIGFVPDIVIPTHTLPQYDISILRSFINPSYQLATPQANPCPPSSPSVGHSLPHPSTFLDYISPTA